MFQKRNTATFEVSDIRQIEILTRKLAADFHVQSMCPKLGVCFAWKGFPNEVARNGGATIPHTW